MIHSRPQTGTFISFVLFLTVSYALLGIQIIVITIDPKPDWFNYAIIVVLIPIIAYVSYKVIFRFKRVSMGDRKIEIRYPQFGIRRSYSLDDVKFWKESLVKTGKNTTYKELEVAFNDGRKIQMGYREYTEYEKLVKYLSQKLAKLNIQ